MKTRLSIWIALALAAAAGLDAQDRVITIDSSEVRVRSDRDEEREALRMEMEAQVQEEHARNIQEKERQLNDRHLRELKQKERQLAEERLRELHGFDPGERSFRLKLNAQHMDSLIMGLDTLLKHLPIPDEIQIDGKGFRWNMPGGRQNVRIIPPPKITEREGILKFGGDAIIGRTERVIGDVVVFDGDATVYGEVQGGVVTVKGDVRLASTAKVEGDVVCIWGNAEVEEGASTGQTTVFNFGRMLGKTLPGRPHSGWMLFFDLFRILLLLAVTALIISAFPDPSRRVTDKLRHEYARSLIVGFLGILIIPVVFLVLLVTIIGIPVALIGLPIAVLAAFLLGGAAVGLRIGQAARDQARLGWNSPAALACFGVLAIETAAMIGKIINVANPVVGRTFLIVNFLIFSCTWIPGFGAVLLTRFGRAPKPEGENGKKRK
ncbi:MAG: polymer-forming cytoskeletal protein [bacterium]|nr:polymer-forming cytoskeletal protein [bacterium]